MSTGKTETPIENSGSGSVTETTGLDTSVLDHAQEFVAVVYRSAPGEYQRLLALDLFSELIKAKNTFNHGKLFAYAEFRVFSREFHDRFPQSSTQQCINAFSRLLLKNDISITNLVSFIEGTSGEDLLLLKDRERLKQRGTID